MPVARTRRPLVQVLWLVLAAVLGVGAMVMLVLWLNERVTEGDVGLRIGDDVFEAGQAEELAGVIGSEGPLLIPDVAGGDRDLILQHLGGDPRDGWHAFAARPLDASRDCVAQWQPDEAHFVDSCDGTTYPADGEGLPRFRVRVLEDGEVEVVVVESNDPEATEEGG